MESFSSGRKKVIDELVKGRKLAKKLRVVLNHSIRAGAGIGSVSAEDLVAQIVNSFSNTLSILNINTVLPDQDLQFPARKNLGLPPRPGLKLKNCVESIKSSTIGAPRGCYKRRKINAHSWTKETFTLADDGHAWRKYGQKVILNAKYPRCDLRNYFRCTNRFDQGCEATKQVQQIEEKPPMYRTKYYGHHTCKNYQDSSDYFFESSSNYCGDSNSILLSFNGNITNKKDKPSISTSLQPVKQQHIKNEASSNLTGSQSSPSLDYLLLADLSTFDCADASSALNSSCMISSDHSLNMDMTWVGSLGFDDDNGSLFEFADCYSASL